MRGKASMSAYSHIALNSRLSEGSDEAACRRLSERLAASRGARLKVGHVIRAETY